MSQSTSPYHTSVFAELRRAITNVAVLHNEPPTIARRRRVVVAITLVLGAAVLGYSLRRHPGESSFYWLTLGLAAVWTVGALSSGPLHLGGICWRGRNQRPVITGTTVGLLLGGAFVVGGLIAREIPAVSALITRVLLFAHHGWLPLVVAITVINGIAEELFFRGALYTALGRYHPVLISTLLYTAATMAAGNPMLGFAAVILGTVCALERRASGGVLAPVLTHCGWGLIMVLALPPVFGL
ncbi:CPBP family intramembrane glutamic endopeptidase [Mycobacterium avium]|uniref:CPBP family intramembrane glutamic endopeptidase n=1 Tax=Mycobacterium avium TaxID=1764 RepID=UPI0003031391|nr:type II CAAX endopeptidase family protein [Mycobacterium avium]AZP80642.1 CPBP family intramembrane metalloprotease [Mycobacterium avium subsp. paratuberculosis]QQK49534.1 CPBP family intramembrane metalloprotease [Mycobacterium avium subsp. paratuberculosis]WAI55675.1 type II CAAX endopeptidase family protein [Mycobacterium avium subsp. paratuberculosis]WPS77628.1 type II CAAX endopeptidase family protein [Mycobacterium avium subsp. paratuberculosis]